MSGVVIDKGIPVPAPGNKKYPWREMQVGDSIFLPGKASTRAAGIRQSAKMTAGGGEWTARVVTEGGVTGIRVWRLA